jgi:putative transposase
VTAPRQVLRGTYLVTRRCAQRQLLLRPSALTNALFRYILAVAASRFGIRLHAFCVLSNHFHLIVTDPEARLPAFSQFLDSLVARAVNASLGRWESFWAPSSYSAVALLSPEDVVDKTAYVLANPVAAGLVPRGRDWPGLWSAPEQVGCGPVAVDRPAFFFRATGTMPATATLELCSPPGFESDADFRHRITAALASREHQANADLAVAGRHFLGEIRVMAQSPWDHARSEEPRRNLNPRIAGRDKWKRIEALSCLVEFRRAYRAAWKTLRSGVKDVIFPAGTYWLRVAHGVRCAAPA